MIYFILLFLSYFPTIFCLYLDNFINGSGAAGYGLLLLMFLALHLSLILTTVYFFIFLKRIESDLFESKINIYFKIAFIIFGILNLFHFFSTIILIFYFMAKQKIKSVFLYFLFSIIGSFVINKIILKLIPNISVMYGFLFEIMKNYIRI